MSEVIENTPVRDDKTVLALSCAIPRDSRWDGD